MSDDLARAIDPYAFASWEGMVAHCLRNGDSQEDAERWATMTYGRNMDDAREKAAAVRSFLLSEERVEAAAKAHCDFFGGAGWWETGLLPDTLPKGREAARAALTAAMGGEALCPSPS